jgi:hypothetical protein
MIVQGGQIGQIVRKGEKVENQYQAINTDDLEYCWRHNIYLNSDWRNPNKEDQKKLDKIRLMPSETKDKDGKIHKARYCKKCFQQVEWTKQPND